MTREIELRAASLQDASNHDDAHPIETRYATDLGQVSERAQAGDAVVVPDLQGLRVMISANSAWNIVNFRAGLVRSLIEHGCEVIAATSNDNYVKRLAELGCRQVSIPLDNGGTSPAKDLRLMAHYWAIMRGERPDVYLGFTIKPNIYGSIAAHLLSVPTINNISGLGTAFIAKTWLTTVVRYLYRRALSGARVVFFQNEDDRNLFVTEGIVRRSQTGVLPGSGVDLAKFTPTFVPDRDAADQNATTFLFVARLLRDKGIVEYVDAARRVRARLPDITFGILGPFDATNRTGIEPETFDRWVREGVVAYHGAADDIRPYLAATDCVVLPSYREGTSRVLLEAAAMGKPIIATNVPGCREVVDNGVNGFLCHVRDAEDLAEKLTQFIDLSPLNKASFGAASRAKAEREFAETRVINRYVNEIKALFAQKN